MFSQNAKLHFPFGHFHGTAVKNKQTLSVRYENAVFEGYRDASLRRAGFSFHFTLHCPPSCAPLALALQEKHQELRLGGIYQGGRDSGIYLFRQSAGRETDAAGPQSSSNKRAERLMSLRRQQLQSLFGGKRKKDGTGGRPIWFNLKDTKWSSSWGGEQRQNQMHRLLFHETGPRLPWFQRIVTLIIFQYP